MCGITVSLQQLVAWVTVCTHVPCRLQTQTVRELEAAIPAAADSSSDADGTSAETDACIRATKVLKVLHGDWATEPATSAAYTTTVSIPIACGGIEHTLNVQLKSGGAIHSVRSQPFARGSLNPTTRVLPPVPQASLFPSDVPIDDIVAAHVSLPSCDDATRGLLSQATSRIRSYIAIITHDMKAVSSTDFAFEFAADAPILRATVGSSGAVVDIQIPFEYDATVRVLAPRLWCSLPSHHGAHCIAVGVQSPRSFRATFVRGSPLSKVRVAGLQSWVVRDLLREAVCVVACVCALAGCAVW